MSDKDLDEVSKIIDINKDASDFYHDAQEKAKSPTVKDIFKDYEQLHKSVVIELQNYVSQKGGDPEAGNTFAGQAGEVWGKVRAALSPNVDESLITSLEEAEDRCIHSIDDAIANDDLSPETRVALKKQQETLHKSHDYMKIMKENVNAAA